MPRRHVRDLVRHHARHFGFVIGIQQNAGIHEKEAARQRERIDLFGIDHFDRERNLGIGVANQVLPDRG